MALGDQFVAKRKRALRCITVEVNVDTLKNTVIAGLYAIRAIHEYQDVFDIEFTLTGDKTIPVKIYIKKEVSKKIDKD